MLFELAANTFVKLLVWCGNFPKFMFGLAIVKLNAVSYFWLVTFREWWLDATLWPLAQ
jgi:hypothetical protein